MGCWGVGRDPGRGRGFSLTEALPEAGDPLEEVGGAAVAACGGGGANRLGLPTR